RVREQCERLAGLTLEGPLEVAYSVYELVRGMMQADALRQNPGFNLRFEVPNAQAASNAQNAVNRANLPKNTPIQIKVVPFL
ncbi:MAG: hypothetical protein MI725_04640, partial [Pirellulales bacterium]|nr:hypothetical protein [Pirellulales bacterium]